MDTVAKYKLELKERDETYTRCRIGGLTKAYYKPNWSENLETFGGSAGLLKNSEYKGYCNLCMTYHSNKSDELPEPGYIVEFSPLYNEYGQLILIEYDCDETFISFNGGGYRDYDTNKIVNAELTFWNNGVFTEFVKE